METSLKNLLYDNPELYEQVYDGAGDEIPRMVVKLCGGAPATLLDIGCGTGRDLEYYDKYGTSCTGVDLQPDMISYAQRRRTGIDFQVGDMRHFRLGRTFQAAKLYPELTVRDTVQLALEARERTSFWGSLLWLPSIRPERRKAAEARRSHLPIQCIWQSRTRPRFAKSSRRVFPGPACQLLPKAQAEC